MSSTTPPSRWSLLIYRVTSEERQQRILRAFHRIAWPGMSVLGTQCDGDLFVIVDCDTLAHELHARRIIGRIDNHAVRMLRSRMSHLTLVPEVGSEAGQHPTRH